MTSEPSLSGPLRGVKVLEVEGTGGSPYAAMLLADLGAEVIRIERPNRDPASIGGTDPGPVLGRGRRCVLGIDLKQPDGLALLLELAATADVLIEAFRPGVAERLGFGPEVVRQRNPRLVYGRLTGWGREGPLAMAAGHDINFVALAGLLGQSGRKALPPTPPLAIGGDMGGGLFLALGIACALFERNGSGRGQVVDAAMVDSASSLMAAFWGFFGQGQWSAARESNLTDGGAPMYDSYRCRDGRYITVGALEPRFFAVLKEKIGLVCDTDPHDPSHWAGLRARLEEIFLAQTCDEWCALLEGTDACFAPVLDFATAPSHPHIQARRSLVDLEGITQPAATPRLDRTPGRAQARGRSAPAALEALQAWAISPQQVAGLRAAGVLHVD